MVRAPGSAPDRVKIRATLDRNGSAPPEAIQTEIDRRLHVALYDAGRSALGMPGTVDIPKLGTGRSHYPAT